MLLWDKTNEDGIEAKVLVPKLQLVVILDRRISVDHKRGYSVRVNFLL